MASLQAFSSVLFFLLAAHACMASMDLINTKCKKFAADDQGSYEYDYCEKTLRAGRASATADELGLAAIAARAAGAAAGSTRAGIARLQGAETVPSRRECLAMCGTEYDATVRQLGRAAKEAARGGSVGLHEAQRLLAEALGAPARCDGVFMAAGQGSPLTDADRELDHAVELALSILPTPPPTKH